MKRFTALLLFGLCVFISPEIAYASDAECIAESGICGRVCRAPNTIDYSILCSSNLNRCCKPPAPPPPPPPPVTCFGGTCCGPVTGNEGACYRGGDYFDGVPLPCPGGMVEVSRDHDLLSAQCGWSMGDPVDLVCCRPAPTYTISGQVWLDTDRDGQKDTGETGYAGATVRRGSVTRTTDGNGNYAFSGLLAGTYTISIVVPANHLATTGTSRSASVGGSKGNINFGIVPIYSISGSIFNDVDKDYLRDANETKEDAVGAFSSNGGSIAVNASAGTYTVSNLFAGVYSISYASAIPAGYQLLYPISGPPPTFLVRVGPGCSVTQLNPNPAGRNVCNSRGDVSNLHFVITNSIPWFQTYGFDVRMDGGVSNIIPANPIYPAYASIPDRWNALLLQD